jgi:hypothetical protein
LITSDTSGGVTDEAALAELGGLLVGIFLRLEEEFSLEAVIMMSM